MIWTVERNRALKEMLTSGLSADEIASRFGCSVSNVRNKITALALTKYSDGVAEDICTLKRSGLSFAEIGRRTGLSARAVRAILIRIGAVPDPKRVHRKSTDPVGRWPSEKDADLRALLAQGLCDAHIARELGFTQPTIRLRIKKLGLSSNAYKHEEDWSDAHKKILEDKLRDGCSFREIAKLVGRSRGAVAGKAQRMGLRNQKPKPPKRERPRKEHKPMLPEPIRLTDLPEERSDAAVLFGDLSSSRQCRWPVAGHGLGMWCCAQQVDKTPPYCAAHRLRSRAQGHRKRGRFIVQSVRGGAWA